MKPLSGTVWVGEMDDRVYHSDPCVEPSLSSSLAGIICNESLAHANLRHPKFGGQPIKSSTDMDDGDMLHALLLTGDNSELVALIDELNPKTKEAYADFKTKRARELRDIALEQGKTPVLPHKMRIIRSMYQNIYEAMCAKDLGLIGHGQAEQVVLWTETAKDGMEVQCRAKLDHWDLERQLMTELKTGASAKPSKCEKRITDDGLDIQLAAYESALVHHFPDLAGRDIVRWVFVEKEPPWAVTEMWPSEAMLEIGRRKWRYAVNRFAEALESGYWPDYTGKEPVHAFPSAWAMEDAERRFGDE